MTELWQQKYVYARFDLPGPSNSLKTAFFPRFKKLPMIKIEKWSALKNY